MAERTDIDSGMIRVDASGRRQYRVDFKRRLAEMALEPGVSVAGIVLAHRINTNQLFKWRQDYLRQVGPMALKLQLTGQPKSATLLPVVVASTVRPVIEAVDRREVAAERDGEPQAQEPGQIEIALGRVRVPISGAVDPALLKTVLTHLQR